MGEGLAWLDQAASRMASMAYAWVCNLHWGVRSGIVWLRINVDYTPVALTNSKDKARDSTESLRCKSPDGKKVLSFQVLKLLFPELATQRPSGLSAGPFKAG